MDVELLREVKKVLGISDEDTMYDRLIVNIYNKMIVEMVAKEVKKIIKL